MNFGTAMWWLGRMAFLGALLGLVYQLYRTLATSGAAPAAGLPQGRLLLVELGESSEVWLKEGAGKQRRLSPGAGVALGERLAIGRGPENTLRVVDPYVSARHCVVRRRGGSFVIADLGTTNGTRVGERPVRGRALLEPGTTVEVGRARFRFEVE